MTYITQSTSKESGVGSRILIMAFVVLGIIAMQSRPVHAQWTTNGNNINNTNSGNVGIGTTTPGALLHGKRDQNTNTTVVIENADMGAAVYSALEVRNGTTYADSIRVQAMGSSWPSNGAFAQDSGVITASANLSNGLSIMTQANAPIRFYTNGQAYERMRIDPSGNVGIGTGTTTPTEKLQVSGNLSVTGTGDISATGTITGVTIKAQYQDVAEWVESSQSLTAGTVVVLDHTRSNQVIASSQAYDTRGSREWWTTWR